MFRIFVDWCTHKCLENFLICTLCKPNLQIVSKNLSEPIRSHKDLDKDSAPCYNKAVKFYEGLSKQLVNQGHVLDLFACAPDQVICFCLLDLFPPFCLYFC